MAISIDWATKVITVPKADTTLVSIGPPEIRSLNVDTFRLALNGLQAGEEGMPEETTHEHTPPLTVGGVTLARVVEIINGYTVTFENGAYAVNLEGANNNIGDVLNLNTVSVRSSNSAGLTFSKQVEDQSFLDGRVFIDTTNGQPGTSFPIGTPGTPVDNLADAQTIITNRTLPKRLFVQGTLTIGASEDISHYNIAGSGSHGDAALVFTAGCNTSHAAIQDIDLSGTLGGEIHLFNSVVTGLTGFEGSMIDSGLEGTITLANTDAGDRATFVNCHSMVAGASRPVIDCNNIANLELNVRGYHGGLDITNITLASMVGSIDLDSANLVLDSSNTNGTLVIRGIGSLTDNTAGTIVTRVGFVEGQNVEELWQLQGLDIANPMTATPTSRVAGDVSQTITGDGVSTTTVTKDP